MSILKTLNIDRSRVNFHKGWFDQTFPKARIDQIALLHIDADFMILSGWRFELGSDMFLLVAISRSMITRVYRMQTSGRRISCSTPRS